MSSISRNGFLRLFREFFNKPDETHKNLRKAYIDMELTEENAKIFATYPRDGVTIPQALATSMIGTALMVHSIFGVNDAKNKSKPQESVSSISIT